MNSQHYHPLHPDPAMQSIAETESLNAEESLSRNGRSFAWARRFLGHRQGNAAARLYALCRQLDDMADGDITDGPQRLASIHADLQKDAARPETTDPALAAALPLIERLKLPKPVLTALIEGLLMDQQQVAIADQRALLRYAYRVAGTVGLLMLRVLDTAEPRAAAHAIDMGIAMQLTNIARDVLEDAQMGRRYLPADWVGGMSAADISAAAAERDQHGCQQIRDAVRRCLVLAETYYASGQVGLGYLPLRAHLAILVASRVYRQIGCQLLAKGCRFEDGRVVTTGLTKTYITLAALPLMACRLVPMQKHQQQLHLALKGLPDVAG